jgi:hypothetical protein
MNIAIVVAILAILVFGAGVVMTRVGLFTALIEIWKLPRHK